MRLFLQNLAEQFHIPADVSHSPCVQHVDVCGELRKALPDDMRPRVGIPDKTVCTDDSDVASKRVALTIEDQRLIGGDSF